MLKIILLVIEIMIIVVITGVNVRQTGRLGPLAPGAKFGSTLSLLILWIFYFVLIFFNNGHQGIFRFNAFEIMNAYIVYNLFFETFLKNYVFVPLGAVYHTR